MAGIVSDRTVLTGANFRYASKMFVETALAYEELPDNAPTISRYRKVCHPEGELSEIEFRNLKVIVLKMYEAGNRDPFLLEMRKYVLNV